MNSIKNNKIISLIMIGIFVLSAISILPNSALAAFTSITGGATDYNPSYSAPSYNTGSVYSGSNFTPSSYTNFDSSVNYGSFNYNTGSVYSGFNFTPSSFTNFNYNYNDFSYDTGSVYSGFDYTPSTFTSFDSNIDYNAFSYDTGSVYSGFDYTPSTFTNFDSSANYGSFAYDTGSVYSGFDYKQSDITKFDSSVDYGAFNYETGSVYSGFDYTPSIITEYDSGEYGNFNTIDDSVLGSSCENCGEEVVVAPQAQYERGQVGGSSHSTPQYERRQTGGGSGMGIVSDLLDLAVGISTSKSDNDTTITTDSHDKVTYKVNNTDNSDRSIRNNYTYTDNSKIDNSIVIKNYYSDGDDSDNGSNNSDLRAICRVSATQVRVGDTVNFVADVSGGDSPYEYTWLGDGNGDGSSETFRFNREGTYSLSVRVTDDSGDTDTDGCATVTVDNNAVNNTGINNPPNGTLASLNSVFLSQVPYTGLADNGGILKIVGCFLGILVWAVAIVYFIAKRKSRMGVKNKMEAFRTFNKFSPKIV